MCARRVDDNLYAERKGRSDRCVRSSLSIGAVGFPVLDVYSRLDDNGSDWFDVSDDLSPRALHQRPLGQSD